jgi:hypothetical protein
MAAVTTVIAPPMLRVLFRGEHEQQPELEEMEEPENVKPLSD